MPGLGEMLDEVPRELKKSDRPSRARRGARRGRGSLASWVLWAIASSDPASDTLYRTAADSHPAVPAAQANLIIK